MRLADLNSILVNSTPEDSLLLSLLAFLKQMGQGQNGDSSKKYILKGFHCQASLSCKSWCFNYGEKYLILYEMRKNK